MSEFEVRTPEVLVNESEGAMNWKRWIAIAVLATAIRNRSAGDNRGSSAWKRWIVIAVLAAWVALIGATPGAWAQGYRFALDRNISHVIVNRDGSADVEYWLTFTCDKGAHPIEIVDVGMPNKTYDLSTAQAWYSPGTGGTTEVPLTDIRRSTEMDVGIEVHMAKYAIQPAKQGTLHLKIRVKEMVYPDSEDEAYASVEFAPAYYVSQVVHGKTYMEIHFYFPAGVTNEQTRYHGKEFDEVDLVGDRIVFIYTYPNTTGSKTYQHGISFPRTYVDRVYKAPVVVGGSKGGSGLSGLPSGLFGFGCFGFVILVIVGASALGAVQSKSRRMAYLPPSLSVEGVGIKRGLTAVEAAILLEKPLNKVLTMILFGLLKKTAVTVLSDDPLKLKAASPLPKRKWRAYEKRFLEAIKTDGTLDQAVLQEGIISLIKSVNKKLKGFSRKETVAYYKSIVNRAWDQVIAETTPEVKSKYFDQGLEWMMIDEKFEDRTKETFSSGPVLMPPWWAYYRPWVPRVRSARSGGGSSSRPSPASGGGGGRQVTLPTLPGAAFAGTIVGGMERTAGGIVSRLESFTGGVTRRTNPLPKSSGSRGSSFKSGGCACACACACAGCACACAGGGR